MHPHEGSVFTEEIAQNLQPQLSLPYVVAVGEIGLDYYYNHSDHDAQRAAFRRQLQMAQDADLPVEIHTRDAEADTIEILNEYQGKVRGVIHCFTGTLHLAQQCLDRGYNISFSGIVTFKSAEALREVLRYVPLDRLHVETDAPFLAPVPMRGRKNKPSYMLHTAKFVADFKGVDLEVLKEQTWQNAVSVFPKLRA